MKSGYFYHVGFWIDLNGDGRKDYLTARSDAKEDGGELVWFEHPVGGFKTTPWNEHLLTKGPDAIFKAVQNIKGYESSIIIFAAEFFNKRVKVYELKGG